MTDPDAHDAKLLTFCDYHGEIEPRRLGSSAAVDESYTLKVTLETFDIGARSPVGVLRAFATLEQLVRWDGERHVLSLCSGSRNSNINSGMDTSSTPSSKTTLLTITDAPRFPWRGLMLDTARHFYPMPALRKIVDGMEMLKMSVFHWHIVDAQSFPYESRAHPLLSSKGAFNTGNGDDDGDGSGSGDNTAMRATTTYSPADVKQFVQYCADRGVRLIPEFDVPGHTASWGKGYPSLTVSCPAQIERDAGTSVPMREHGIDRVAMHPLRNETFRFLDAFFKEVFEAFPDSMLHIGGDEVNGDCWAVDPEINAWAEAHGPTWARQLQGMFEQRVLKMLRAGGKRAMVWDEVLDMPGATSWLNPGTIVHWWRGWIGGTPGKAARAGLDVVMSAPWYLDHVGDDWLKMYKARIDEDFSTSPGGAGSGGGGKLLGGEACSWSEHANEVNMEHRIFSRLPSVAERLWSPAAATTAAMETSSRPALARRLGATLCGLRQRAEIAVGPAYPDFCAAEVSSSAAAASEAWSRGGSGAAGKMSGDISGSNSVDGGGISESDLEDALSSMREWQFLATVALAVICFGCAALLAWYVARSCCGKRDRHGLPPVRKIALTTLQAKRKKTTAREKKKRAAGGGLASVAEDAEEEEEEEEEEQHSDDDRQGLLEA